jgi:hypothetical protein
MKYSAFPLILIIIGSVWFLNSNGWMPSTPVVLAILLMIAGISVWLMDGMVKSSIVNGTMLIYSGGAVYASYEYGIGGSHLISLGFVLAGILMLLARHDSIPEKKQHTYEKKDFEQ